MHTISLKLVSLVIFKDTKKSRDFHRAEKMLKQFFHSLSMCLVQFLGAFILLSKRHKLIQDKTIVEVSIIVWETYKSIRNR